MICIDSTCIIDFLKGMEEAVKVIEKHKESIITTEVNVFEVFFGIYKKQTISTKEEALAIEFFNSIEVLALDKECGKKAAKILASLMKEGKVIEQNDVLIASILERNEIKSIITRNVKHFFNIENLEVISY